jgi:hypothetical protein
MNAGIVEAVSLARAVDNVRLCQPRSRGHGLLMTSYLGLPPLRLPGPFPDGCPCVGLLAPLTFDSCPLTLGALKTF